MIVEEVEEGEIVDDEDNTKIESKDERVSTKITPLKKKNRRTGEELEEGEIVSSDDDAASSPKKSEVKKVANLSHVPNNKEKRIENKENRVDKKKKGKCLNVQLTTNFSKCFLLGPKPRWVPLDIEPPSVRPKSQKAKSARQPKDVSNNTPEGRKVAGKGLFCVITFKS